MGKKKKKKKVSADAALPSLRVYFPGGTNTKYEALGLTMEVVANGTLILRTAGSDYAFSPGQWLTVNKEPV